MHKRTVLAGYASIFLLLAMFGALFVTPVRAAETWTVDDDGPADFSTIQAAINAAGDGDTIQVASGIYKEPVVVDKSLTLVGENSRTTIIDGNRTGTVVHVGAPDVNITGFTVQNGGDWPESGIRIGSLGRNTIRECIIRNNAYGIELFGSNNTIIVGNKIMNNSDAGILIRDGSNNDIHNNLMANNSFGVYITSDSSLSNSFYHNNFIDNPASHAQDFGLDTKWDNGAEGNYWSDYTGDDLDGDGIGDTAYEKGLITDHYPLMEPWSPYRVFPYNVTTFSNSTLASFDFSRPLEQISFKVTSGASGFCNVTIPETLLNVSTLDKWIVIIDNLPVSRTVTYNGTHYSIYFTYSKGLHTVQVTTRQLISSIISIALSEDSISVGDSVTISGNITAADDSERPNATVTIQNRTKGDVEWDTLATVTTDQNGIYTCPWEPKKIETYEVKAKWIGDEETLGNQSEVLTLTVKWSSIISITLSEDSIPLGKSVIISGNITVADDIARAGVNVTILYKLSGVADWTTLTAVETDESGNYTYGWTPRITGTYEFKASWEGDPDTYPAQSDARTLIVEEEEAEGIPLEIVAAIVVAIIVIAAIAVYFVKVRKP